MPTVFVTDRLCLSIQVVTQSAESDADWWESSWMTPTRTPTSRASLPRRVPRAETNLQFRIWTSKRRTSSTTTTSRTCEGGRVSSAATRPCRARLVPMWPSSRTSPRTRRISSPSLRSVPSRWGAFDLWLGFKVKSERIAGWWTQQLLLLPMSSSSGIIGYTWIQCSKFTKCT